MQEGLRVDGAGDVVRIEVRGRFTVALAREQLERLSAEEPTRKRLWDLREADLSAMTPDSLREIAYISGQQPAPGPPRVAALVTKDLEFGISRMFEAFAAVDSAREYAVFRDEQAALDWLG